MKFKENKGITLVALSITIIILLVLSGITVIVLFGSNGLFKKATESNTVARYSTIEDRIMLWRENNRIKEAVGENLISRNEFIESLKKDGLFIKDEDKLDQELDLLYLGKYTDNYGENYTKVIILPDPNDIKLPDKNMVLIAQTIKPNEEVVFQTILCDDIKITWGDKTEGTIIKESYTKHIYETPGRYEIRIIGSSYGTASLAIPYEDNPEEGIKAVSKSNIVGIKQWGQNQFLVIGYLGGNIKELPTQEPKYLSRTIVFNQTFKNCKDLRTIPDNLFKGFYNIETFDGVFEGCDKLENIPFNLFNHLRFCKNYSRAFANCINLKSTMPSVWAN